MDNLRSVDSRAEFVGQPPTESQNLSTSTPKATTWQWLLAKVRAPGQRRRLKDVEGKLHQIDQRNYYDDNSPVLMVDQLWLWVIDEGISWCIRLVLMTALTDDRNYCYFFSTSSI